MALVDVLEILPETYPQRKELLRIFGDLMPAVLRARDPKSPRRTCHVWRRQFDELLREHRASWNSHPNPKFDLDAIATGCVAVVRAEHDPIRRVLTQARLNCAARAAAEADQRA